MTKLQKQVKEFHQTFDIKIEDKPTVPDADTAVLRHRLIDEELAELEVALGFLDEDSDYLAISQVNYKPDKCDLVAVADALGDLLYVIYGTAVSLGIDLEPVTDEIHRSNMTKVGGHKREDGKWVKPDTYSPADIKTVLEAQQ